MTLEITEYNIPHNKDEKIETWTKGLAQVYKVSQLKKIWTLWLLISYLYVIKQGLLYCTQFQSTQCLRRTFKRGAEIMMWEMDEEEQDILTKVHNGLHVLSV